MSKPTLDQIIWAVYVIKVNVDGWCPYCQKSMLGKDAEFKEWHFDQYHTDVSVAAHQQKGKP